MNTELIKQLRQITFLGMTECKRALEETNDNLEEAVKLLQSRGKKIDPTVLPLEGVVKAKISEDCLIGAIVECNVQTDFACKTEIFQNLVNQILDFSLSGKFKEAKALTVTPSKQLGELVVLRRVQVVPVISSVIYNGLSTYNHPNGKLSVLLSFTSLSDENVKLGVCMENIAMQIAANNPKYLSKNDVESSVLDCLKQEFSVGLEKKPEAIRQKIIDGKMQKWFAENCLMEQLIIFQEGSKLSVRQYLDQIQPGIEIVNYIRYQLGEKLNDSVS